MSNIEEVLMRRDGISREEAYDRVKYCKSRLANEAIPSGDYNLAEISWLKNLDWKWIIFMN